jgi:transposase-like protein
MELSKRRTHSPEFKARVAMEAISGRKTIQEIAADHAIHPIQVSQWKRQLLDGASELFTRGKKTKDKEEGQAKEAELFQQIGRLQMELEWLNKRLSLPGVNYIGARLSNRRRTMITAYRA